MSDLRTVTLVTGDRVTLTGAPDHPVPHVELAAGRAHVGYVAERRGRDLIVIPRDVAPLVAAGALDRALFNVTELVAAGYSDADRDDLPLLLSGEADSATGLVLQRRIDALHVTAVRQPKGSGAAIAWLRAALASPRRSGAAPRLSLDRHHRRALPAQAPATAPVAARAAAAYTGQGVTVAVIDTGIDTTHPDLAGVVIAAQSFVDSDPGNGDPVGFGTFTASVIAGSGALNHGAYRGIAPDARLLDARACDDVFCDDSALLAAMAWAVVERHAPIVSLAVGDSDNFGEPSLALDPVEAAIEQLSAQYGTLFVTPAGDEGENGAGLFLTPGTAPSALTVGAINRAGRLAAWSSRGPSPRRDAIKPDLTALGVAVVGAAAPGIPLLGAETDDGYQAISSTVAAVPNAAGAAAVLLQAHPGWAGAALKAALVGAADPDPSLTPDDQGAGRLDLDRAMAQAALVEPASLELGVAQWPHDDDPVQTRILTYRNAGTAPITLALSPRLALPNGDASNHMLQVAPATLTIPPGQAATATVTVDTRGDARDARYGGEITATGDGVRLTTPIAVEREVESYNLSLHVADRAGADTDATVLIHARHPDGTELDGTVSGTATLRLPREDYALHVFPDDPQLYMAYPDLVLDHDTAIDFDGQQAQAIAPEIPGVTLSDDRWISVLAWDVPNNDVVWSVGYGAQYTKHFGPDNREVRSWTMIEAYPEGSPLARPPVGWSPGVSDRYLLARQERDHLLTGWRETIPASKLTTVDEHARDAGEGVVDLFYQRYRGVTTSDIGDTDLILPSQTIDDYAAGVHHTEHYYGTDMRWWTDEIVFATEPFPFGLNWMERQHAYAPGAHLTETYNRAPIGPAIVSGAQYPGAFRRGDSLTILASRFSPRDVPAWQGYTNSTHAHQTLYRDGQIVFDDPEAGGAYMPPQDVPPETATYRLEVAEGRGINASTGDVWTDLSTEVTASWTFRSSHTPDGVDTPLPLPTLRFLPELTEDNRAPGRVLILPAQIQRPEGAPVRPITRIVVEVSFDDGATWREVRGAGLGDDWLGVVIQPANARFASLRAAVDDIDGRHSELSIVHAYKL